MKPLGRLGLLLPLLVLGCGEDPISEPPCRTTDNGPGEPCESAVQCQESVAGARCGEVVAGEGPVCFLPCDLSAAEPGCDCKPLAGASPDLPNCDRGTCSGFCPMPRGTCEN